MIARKNTTFQSQITEPVHKNLEKKHNFLNFMPRFTLSLNAYLEAILLPLAIPALLWILGSQDILLLQTAFPWLILVPIIIAARYGTWLALLSLSVLALLSISYTLLYQETFFDKALNVLTGNLLIVIFVGEMLHYWKLRYNETALQAIKCEKNKEKTEQELQLLHIAFSQLEENLVTTTQSVTKSLQLLEVSLQPALDKKQQVKLAIKKLHAILKEYQWIEESVFFYVDNNEIINPMPLASKARFASNLHNDILVRKAIENKRTVISKENNNPIENKSLSKLQAAIPLVDSHQHLWGVMAVVHLTPSIFQQQNLNLLSLLCRYVANLLRASEHPITTAKSLHLETSTAINIVLNSVRSVFFIQINIPSSSNHDKYKAFFTHKIKGISRIWQLQKEGGIVLVMLVPLFKKSNASIWQSQLEGSFIKQFLTSLNNANIKITVQHLQKNSHKP